MDWIVFLEKSMMDKIVFGEKHDGLWIVFLEKSMMDRIVFFGEKH